LLSDLPRTCYGAGSIYDRLHDEGARIITVGLGLYWATYRHYIEEHFGVPFRFSKLFTGIIRDNSVERTETWSYYASPFTSHCGPIGVPLEKLAREAGICRVAAVGRSEVCSIGAREYRACAVGQFSKNPWLAAMGPPLERNELIAKEDERVGAASFGLNLSPDAGMMEIVEKVTPLPRDIVSSGIDSALDALSQLVPMTVHEYPSGTPCFTWIIPEKWTCLEGWLETLGGQRLLDYRENPLHVMSYSDPFDGEVSREELLAHLEVHPYVPSAVPFSYSYFRRRWGLCCSRDLRDSLRDERYRVCIKAGRSFSTLKVGEVIVPGASDSGFVLCAHLDHPGQANDGLSGVAVGIEVMRRLLADPSPRHTVRLLIVSETFGSLAWLSNHMDLVPGLHAGIFLEMLGLEYPHALQYSKKKDTVWDRIAREVLQSADPRSWADDFLKVVTNDDRQFNAPGIRVPMLSLSRVKEACGTGEGWPFAEYHSDLDNAARVSAESMNESVEMVLSILGSWDRQTVPMPLYQAEPCLTRFGVHFDFTSNPKLATQLFDVMHAIDGRLSMEEISIATGVDMDLLESVLKKLAASGLVRL
jgi:aminopeptidase-like protein